MKLLNGRELAEFIKERQAKEVRRLKQSEGVLPRLAIIQMKDDPIINTYVRLKKRYGDEMGIAVDIHHPSSGDAVNLIDTLNSNPLVHGIIVQLPIDEPAHTERVINAVSINKDVDGLAKGSQFDPATPTAIFWLLSGYGIELQGKKIVIVGNGPLVGAPLARMLVQSGHQPTVLTRQSEDAQEQIHAADIVISAAGQPGLIQPEYLKHKSVVIDAGTADADGKTVGDVAQSVYDERDDIKITPQKGGIGPLTVCALFENVLIAARNQAVTAEL